MKINPFTLTWLIGLTVFLFGVYGPRVREFKKTRKNELRSSPLDMLLDFSTYLTWQILPFFYIFGRGLDFANYGLPAWAGWIGVILFAASIYLYWRAYRDLGRNWSPRIEIMAEQQLVTGGVYSRIRHPVYAAMWLWVLAQPLLIPNWIARLGMLVTFTPLYLLRTPKEEKMMLDNFGEAYRAYMDRTGRIIPKF
ncbi:MAG: protein-S-isoprenylcysteine O-methyltransferase [Chloroflexota bacterium]